MVQAVSFFGLNRLAGGTPGASNPRAVLRRRVPAKFGIPARAAILPRGRPGTVSSVPEFLAGYRGTECPALAAKDVRSSAAHWSRPGPMRARAWDGAAPFARPGHARAFKRFGEQAARVNAKLYAALFPDAPACSRLSQIGNRPGAADRRSCPARFGIAQGAVYAGPVRGAFTASGRRARLLEPAWLPAASLPRTAGNGTAFFWGVDGRGRRHPLRLSPDNGAFEFPGFHLPLVPEAVIGALRDRNIYPGLFVSYMTLALEHGLCCHGGIFLVRYLPTMLHAVRDLFMECGEPLPPLPGRTMLAAFAISMQARETGRLFPAGMLELLTSGGISRADLQRLADLPLEAVLPLSLARWCLDYTPRSQRTPAWEADLRNVAWEGLTIEVS